MRLYLCNNKGDKTLNTFSTLAAIDTEGIGKKSVVCFTTPCLQMSYTV